MACRNNTTKSHSLQDPKSCNYHDPGDIILANIKIDHTTSCWEWQKCRDKDGYGKTNFTGKSWLAHRLSYFVFVGEIPHGLCVCHSCDNPGCVNPSHLWVGTHSENVADKTMKQRHARGSMMGAAKLSEPDILAIRKRYSAGGVTKSELGIEYGVGHQAIGKIIRGETWKHISREQ